MSSPTAPIIAATGITAPAYSALLSYFQSQYQNIFGNDSYLSADSQDGQLLAIFAAALSDSNSAALAAYASFSPATGTGAALSSNVKINGLARLVPTNSTANVTIVGTVGTTITNGVVGDAANLAWSLPASVVIPSAGTITVTATCQTPGAITAGAGTITHMLTPTLGWQSVTNPAAASPGQPVETDAALRVRQAASTMIPSLGIMDGIIGALEELSGVTAVKGYVNATGSTDANGVPAYSIALVVLGGTASQIASVIATKKPPGVPTAGTTTQSVTVPWSSSALSINYYVPAQISISVGISLHALTGYLTSIGAEVAAAVAAHINALGIGQSVLLTRLWVPANLAGPYASPASPIDPTTFELVSVTIAITGSSLGSSDIAIAFNQLATCLVSNITVSLV